MSNLTGLETDESDDAPFNHLIGWAGSASGYPMREDVLPASLASALATLRGRMSAQSLSCLAYRTLVDGVETARMGPNERLPPDDELIVLSVITTEASTSRLQVTGHTLLVHAMAT
jgi:hypothetical protein